ncbi:MAG: M55 family metallopeptidase [Desulfobacterales bacterium]|nr:M55 family metallopeptidase [Desulfobacterales bacterium]
MIFGHVLIIADIEGSSGCPDYEASSFMTAKWALACLEMTRDVNAVASALLDAGVRVTIHDFHRTGYNLIGERIDPRAKLVQGYRRGPVPGLGHPGTAEAVVFIGLHAASGTDGFLAHTLTSRIVRLAVNGRPLTEVALFAASLAPYGVRPLFFTGCPVACDQARAAIPGIATFAVHKPFTTGGQGTEKWRQAMARAAVNSLKTQAPPPFMPIGPFQAEVRFRDGTAAARQVQTRWAFARTGNTILLEADTLANLYDDLIKIAYLTPWIQAFLPLGLFLYRILGMAGIAWVKLRLKSQ